LLVAGSSAPQGEGKQRGIRVREDGPSPPATEKSTGKGGGSAARASEGCGDAPLVSVSPAKKVQPNAAPLPLQSQTPTCYLLQLQSTRDPDDGTALGRPSPQLPGAPSPRLPAASSSTLAEPTLFSCARPQCFFRPPPPPRPAPPAGSSRSPLVGAYPP
jgi:hypothetical protein